MRCSDQYVGAEGRPLANVCNVAAEVMVLGSGAMPAAHGVTTSDAYRFCSHSDLTLAFTEVCSEDRDWHHMAAAAGGSTGLGVVGCS